jgi:uncharacterized protein
MKGIMRQELNELLMELKKELLSIYRIRLIDLVLFGSQARGDDEEGSDIDIMIILKGRFNPSREITRCSKLLSSLSLKYDKVITCVFMSKERYSKEKSPLLINVRREGVIF